MLCPITVSLLHAWTGDFVYVRSDQERPFIARINKMWTDAK